MSAWIDESVLVGDDRQPGAYTLAAVIADHAAIEGLRDELRALTERKVVRLHWVAESAKRRYAIAGTVAGLDIVAIVVVGSPVQRQKQERARRCCLEHLFYAIAGAVTAANLGEPRWLLALSDVVAVHQLTVR
ncbi:hypothetical protein [Kribbella kalugense]|uniref:hypothetical protein n=1 Tax=Kribbella kalugense TaxID=2512221 RepID=UPI00106714FA|nr:hypothetical protein [Kribbella kalugense]